MPNLLRFVLCLVIATNTSAYAQTTPDCSTAAGTATARTQIETTLESASAYQKTWEAKLDAELKSRASASKWSKEHQSQLFMNILSSPKFTAFENEKRPYTAELMQIALSALSPEKKADPKQVCATLLRLKTIVDKVKPLNDKQYSFMLNEIKTAK